MAWVWLLSLAVGAEGLFESMSLEKAGELARQRHKRVLVEFSASWCGPCKVMEKTTFADPQVIDYCRSEFVPVRLDIQLDSAEAKRLGVGVVPSLLVLQDGREVDRTSGLKSSQELLAWLKQVGSGPNQLDSLRRALQLAPDQARAHYDLAEALTEREIWPEALKESLWIWDHPEQVKQEHMSGLRHSSLLSIFKRLVKAYAPARPVLQDRLQSSLEGETNLPDWLNLSNVLEQEAAAADYVLAHPNRFRHLQREIFDLLCRQGRWSQGGAWLDQPDALAQAVWAARLGLQENARGMPGEVGERLASYAKTSSHRHWRDLIKALRAAERDSEAEEIRDWILQQDAEAQL